MFQERNNFVMAILFCLCACILTAQAQSTGFTYQGSLNNSGLPATGNYDFEFKLFNALTGGTQEGTSRQVLNVPVSNGTFTVEIDVGAGSFPGADRFMEIGVRPAGGGNFTTLSPRRQITRTPYAINSGMADQALFAVNANNAQNAVNAQTALTAANADNATTANNAIQLGGTAANQFVQTTDPRLADPRNPLPGNTNYIQNSNSQQAASNFNIGGNGTAGGILTGGIVNALTQFAIGGNRILSNPGTLNLFAGTNAGRISTGNGNSFFGADAGFSNTSGQSNSFFGVSAGKLNSTVSGNSFFGAFSGAKNTTGGFNAFFGSSSGSENTTGSSNSFFGADAGKSNTTGTFNAFFGTGAGEQNTIGASNAFFGRLTGELNTTGTDNSFYGSLAGNANTAGRDNSFVGRSAGGRNVDGDNNSFLGRSAGFENTTGNGNSFVGRDAGNTNSTGSNNTIIGYDSDLGTNNLTNASAVGYKAFVETNDSLVLGSVNGKNGATADTKVGIGTTTPDASLDIERETFGPSLQLTNYGSNSVIQGRSSSGTRANPTATLSGDNLLTISAFGRTDQVFAIGAKIEFTATQDWDLINNKRASINFFSNSVVPPFSTVLRMKIDENGSVGIGTDSPAEKLDVAGDIRVGFLSGTTGCIEDRDGTVIAGTCSSDLRFKKNITSFGNILNNFTKLRPVNFFWRADEFPDKQFGKHESFGLIAQEAEEIFPELVATDEKGYKLVNYSKLPLLTIQAVKEQQAQIEEQRGRIEQQAKQIEQLKSVICSLYPALSVCSEEKK
ncbi:MAG: tail fiber domain-containing protein [Blastocatellia bacterium]